MAFKNGLSERLDELRFPSPRSPPSESAFPGYNSLSPGHSNFGSGFSRPSNDVRANLQRRFTTDSSKLSSWNYLNQGPSQMPDPLDLLSSFEKKRQHIEYMREQKRRFEEDMKLLDMQHEKEKIEMDQLARDLAKAGLQGPVSEPTTPPEYRDTPVSAAVSRPARFSTSSVTSSPGFFNAFAPSSTLTSPQAPSHGHQSSQSTDRFIGHSLPGSRRNSEKEDVIMEPSTLRSGTSVHRYSLPSSNYNAPFRSQATGFNGGSAIDSFAAAKHLFHNDDEKLMMKDEDRMSTPDIKGIITMTEPDDKFPTLFRRSGSNILSANPDALDLANARTPGPESYSYHARHRSTHQSMPQNVPGVMRLDQMNSTSNDEHGSVTQSRHLARHSLEGGLVFPDRNSEAMTPVPSNRPTSLQSSYSTNDLPTVKGNNGFDNAVTPPKTHAEHLHNHNASMGRIPTGAVSRPTTKESSDSDALSNGQSAQTMLQGSAMSFGPHLTSVAPNNGIPAPAMPFPLYNYGVQPFAAQPVPNTNNNQMAGFPAVNTYGNYNNYGSGYRYNETSGRSNISHRRQTDGDANQMSRFTNVPLEHYKGDLYSLCKDQHGCRYLQRKLEERNADHVQLIFSETYMHVIELMTDPFGNYLCQKLLEYSNDEQRTALINNAAPQLVKIALNQHGTRALQKMIEFISTAEQTQTVIQALQHNVVDLVQDLNGNHVIQKCLNRLGADQAEFIYEAVGQNCVTVGTHRHGCCVLQRCIDHASGPQKARLIAQITSNSFALVQDPFGNYVVQYILDLAETRFTNPICATFAGNIAALSKQKFSSNVIEKCLRTADGPARRDMIDEMLSGVELEKMLRDSFANYVIQTAMDYADGETRNRIIECIRPILPSIRQTPHGRRIAGKIMAAESGSRGNNGPTNGHVTPNEMANTPQIPKNLTTKSMIYQGSAGSHGIHSQALPPTPAMSSSNTPPAGNYTTTPPTGRYNTTPPSGVYGNTPPGGGNDKSALFGNPAGQNLGGGNQLYTYF